MSDLPTEIDPPEAEPPYMRDPEPPRRAHAELTALVEQGLPLVAPVARQLAKELGRLADADELASVGRAALFDAALAFDEQRGPFGPYARKKLRWAMLDSVRRETQGRDAYGRARALRAAERVVDAIAPAAPDPVLPEAAHARQLGAILAAQAAAMVVGLTAPYRDLRDVTSDTSETLAISSLAVPRKSAPPPPPGPDPEDLVLRHKSSEALVRAIATLPPRQREIVERHYYGEERFDHIAESLGISKSWASRLHAQAMEALAKALRDHR